LTPSFEVHGCSAWCRGEATQQGLAQPLTELPNGGKSLTPLSLLIRVAEIVILEWHDLKNIPVTTSSSLTKFFITSKFRSRIAVVGAAPWATLKLTPFIIESLIGGAALCVQGKSMFSSMQGPAHMALPSLQVASASWPAPQSVPNLCPCLFVIVKGLYCVQSLPQNRLWI
jgi:hypothetical protein